MALQHKEEVQKLLTNLESLRTSGNIAANRYEFLRSDYQRQMEAAVANLAAIKSRIAEELRMPKQNLNVAKVELDNIRAAYNKGNLTLSQLQQNEQRLNRYIEGCRAQIAQLQQLLDAKSSVQARATISSYSPPAQKVGFPAWATVIISLTGVVLLGLVIFIVTATNTPKPVQSNPVQPNPTVIVQQLPATVDWMAISQRVAPSVVFIVVRMGNNYGVGSGTIVDKRGYILTSNHVVYNEEAFRAADAICVYQYAGQEISLKNNCYKADIIKRDEARDIAIIKISTNSSLTAIDLGNSDTIMGGEEVRVIGYPMEYIDNTTGSIGRPSVTDGIISEPPRKYTRPFKGSTILECQCVRTT